MPPLWVSLGKTRPFLPKFLPSSSLPLLQLHTRFRRLHLKVDIDKKPDALARYNGGVDCVEDFIPQALFSDFRGIVHVILEAAQRRSCHQERPKRAWPSVLHIRSSKPQGQDL